MLRKVLLALAIAAVLLSCATLQSVPARAFDHGEIGELIGGVSGESVMTTVSNLQDFGSRAFYLNSSKEAAAYIFDRFQDLGLEVHYQNFTASGYETGNVVATLEGSVPTEPRYLFGAHYDSFNELSLNYSIGANTSAPGADDDASGVAAIIELAKVLSTLTLERTIMFVAFGAEELNANQTGGGLAGSTAFVTQQKSAGTEFEGTAILDMIGYRTGTQDRCTLIVRPDGNPLVNATQRAVTDYGLGIELTTISNPWISFSDHWPFWQAGYPSMVAIEQIDPTTFYPVNPFYHSSEDRAFHLSQSQMASMTKAFLAAVLSLDLSSGDGTNQENIVIALVIVVIVAAAVVAIIVFFRTRRT